MEEIFLSVADSESLNIKARIRAYEGETWNASWSLDVKMRRRGVAKVAAVKSCGAGSGGASGTGIGIVFVRDLRLGIFCTVVF